MTMRKAKGGNMLPGSRSRTSYHARCPARHIDGHSQYPQGSNGMLIGAAVFVVDQDPNARSAIETFLKVSGHSVIALKTGQDAMKAMEQARPDLILLDQELPGALGGIEVLTRLQRHFELRHLPVIMMTDHPDRQSILRAARLGATDFITKPVKAIMLKQKVARAWQSLQMERRARRAEGDSGHVEVKRRPGITLFQFDGVMDKQMLTRFISYASHEFLQRVRSDEIAIDLVGLVGMTAQGKSYLASAVVHLAAAQRKPFVIAGRHYETLLDLGLDPEMQIFLRMEDLVSTLENPH